MSPLRFLGNRYGVGADPLRTQRRIELVAVVLALLLCLQLAWGGIRLVTMTAPEPVQPAADSLQVPPVQGPAVVSAGERNEITARPIFWVSRRPGVVVAALDDPDAKAAGPGELGDVKLVGVFGSGDSAGVITLVKGNKQRILLGETLEGWTLESIQPTEGVFTNGARRETLKLQRGKAMAAAAGPSAAGAGESAPARATSRSHGADRRGRQADPGASARTGEEPRKAPKQKTASKARAHGSGRQERPPRPAPAAASPAGADAPKGDAPKGDAPKGDAGKSQPESSLSLGAQG